MQNGTTAIGGDVVEREFVRVVYQRGLPSEVGINGCRVEDVLAVAAEKLERFQDGPLACFENEAALRAIRAARLALRQRIERRQEQGVYHTLQVHETKRTEDEVEDFSATGA